LKLKVIIHETDVRGYRARVPAIPGCATQGDTFDELLANLDEPVAVDDGDGDLVDVAGAPTMLPSTIGGC
jgi:hypothetical protein